MTRALLLALVIVAGCGAVKPVAVNYSDVMWKMQDGAFYDLGFRADGVVVWREHKYEGRE